MRSTDAEFRTQKYLKNYAELEARASFTDRGHRHGLVVPAYGEGARVLDAIDSVRCARTVLVVVVLNARASSEPWVHAANEETRRILRFRFGRAVPFEDFEYMSHRPTSFGSLVLIDRATSATFLPERQGVGLARKIGGDFLLSVCRSGTVDEPCIRFTDADAELPCDYFDRTGLDAAAAIFPFQHRAVSGSPDDAIFAYEIELRYLVLGLRVAGSPYAFHNIGSTIAVDGHAYAAVRGVPKRAAAEDFYLLNKLAKIGPVVTLGGAPIRLSGRVSQRVPFGTGAAMAKMRAAGTTPEQRVLYHPDVFVALKALMNTIARCAESEHDPEEVLRSELGCLYSDFGQPVIESGALSTIRDARRRTSGASRIARRIHTEFDAFRTIKLLHRWRDTSRASIPLRDALRAADFVPADGAGRLERLAQALSDAEK
ncbi:MAG: hypothetical protein AAGJ56_00825 [Myxococcota bacterium]